MIELLPCPFCGGTDATLDDEGFNGLGSIRCLECGAHGPEEMNPDGHARAIAAWNRRALSATPQDPVAPLCDRCVKPVPYDLLVPDEVWARISPKPVEGWKGGGVLCPDCIVAALLDEFARPALTAFTAALGGEE